MVEFWEGVVSDPRISDYAFQLEELEHPYEAAEEQYQHWNEQYILAKSRGFTEKELQFYAGERDKFKKKMDEIMDKVASIKEQIDNILNPDQVEYELSSPEVRKHLGKQIDYGLPYPIKTMQDPIETIQPVIIQPVIKPPSELPRDVILPDLAPDIPKESGPIQRPTILDNAGAFIEDRKKDAESAIEAAKDFVGDFGKSVNDAIEKGKEAAGNFGKSVNDALSVGIGVKIIGAVIAILMLLVALRRR